MVMTSLGAVGGRFARRRQLCWDTMQEAFHLNRLLRLHPPEAEGGERWEPRHIEILISQMGLGDESKAVSTLGMRMTDEDDGKECDAESHACCRSWTMRARHLSQDRRELQFAVKEPAGGWIGILLFLLREVVRLPSPPLGWWCFLHFVPFGWYCLASSWWCFFSLAFGGGAVLLCNLR